MSRHDSGTKNGFLEKIAPKNIFFLKIFVTNIVCGKLYLYEGFDRKYNYPKVRQPLRPPSPIR